MSEMKKDELAEDQALMGDELLEDDPMVAELEAVKVERDELRDRFMRALADAENIRKRGERDRREAEQYGGSKLAKDLLPVYVWRQRPTERDELKNPRRITDAPEGFAGMIAFCPSLAQPRCGPRDVGAQGEDMNVDPVVLNAILGHERLGGWVSHVIESVISATADIMGDTLDAVIVDHAASMGPLAWAALSASAAQKEQRSLFVSNRSAIALSAQGEMARHVRTHPGLQDRAVWLVNQVPTDEMSGAWRTRISEIFPDETWHLRDNVLPARRDSALADTLGSPIIPAGQNSSCDEDLQKVLGRLLR